MLHIGTVRSGSSRGTSNCGWRSSNALVDLDGTIVIGRPDLLEFIRLREREDLQTAKELVQGLPRCISSKLRLWKWSIEVFRFTLRESWLGAV